MSTSVQPAVERSQDTVVLRIDFRPDSANPARIFESMSALIHALERLDSVILAPLPVRVRPALLLQSIEAGSIRTVLRSVIESIDDQSLVGLGSGVLGTYVLRSKRAVLGFISKRESLGAQSDISELQQDVANAAPPELVHSPFYAPPSPSDLIQSAKAIGEGLGMLDPFDGVTYESENEEVELNTNFRVSEEQLRTLVVAESLTNVTEHILQVKKADLLGQSMWDFHLGDRTIPAKITDASWLTRFHNREIPLSPGDSLRVRLRTTTSYDSAGTLVGEHYEVIEVRGELRPPRPAQPALPLPPKE